MLKETEEEISVSCEGKHPDVAHLFGKLRR
jgi:translation initiation factor IF-1